MNANEIFRKGPEAVDLWRRVLEAEIELEEAEDGADLVGNLDELDEDELAEAQINVFSRLGVVPPTGNVSALMAAFMVDLENWRIDASAPALALARDVGSVAETVKVSVPELIAEGHDEVVQFECDLDEHGRITDLAIKISATDLAGPPLTLALLEPNGTVHTTRVSSRGLARFSGLAIEPSPGDSLRFELRR
ncbi:hypothetical protein [Pseudarthrobacter sp. lyk4-40-TYG-27]|uniref:hypothetical protein n=1 Tax=Pseudarthrobacter sp. lyk4-40-TYG-27 TaxID=3040305 RepID=UPI002552B5CA|nr:hypothetical protein [Pseudarthrobacter sp. lyk4-40-TYG-27]